MALISFLRRHWIFLFLFLLVSLWFLPLVAPSQTTEPMPYGEFIEAARNDKVTKVVQQGSRLEVTLVGQSNTETVTLPNQQLDVFEDLCQAAGRDSQACIGFGASEPSPTGQIILLLATSLLPLIIILGVIFFIMRSAGGGSNPINVFGKSRARMSMPDIEKPTVTFADVAGVDESKHELAEIVEFLKFPEKFNALGARSPRGVLLIGPPGVGKTLLARAVSGEAGVPFFNISGSEFVEMLVGVGASRVRDLFQQAKRNSPCIVFIDEIDAVGRQRGAGLGGGHDEREQTLNQILVEMDGFDTNTNVIVVAATNRPDVLDPALLRPGRFDRQVVLDRPDINGRQQILAVHSKGKPLAKEVDLQALARRTPGFSGADLANLMNEAAILAARRERKEIGTPEFAEAIDRIIAGPERGSRLISEAEKRIIAYHEGGHAVVQRMLPKCDPVTKVTVVSRGMALGYTISLPSEDRYLHSKSEFEDKIAGMLGGNAAERLVFGDTTTGAANDFEKSTALARSMVTQYGMSDKMGPLTFGRKEHQVFLGRELGEQRDYSDDIASQIDGEVRRIVDEAYTRASKVLNEQRAILDQLAAILIEEETVEHDQFESLFIAAGLPPRASEALSPSIPPLTEIE